MNKTFFLLSSLFIVLTSSCSESESETPNVKPDSYIVTLSGDNVCMTTGYVCSIDFNITPPSINSPSFINDSNNYIIELKLADSNTTPNNYKLARVELINTLDNVGTTTKYRAYIEDLCLRNDYSDQVKLVLRNKTNGTISASPPFCIKYNLDSLSLSLLDTGLPLVIIETINHETPTCDYVSHPDHCWGDGITNVTKVPGSLEIMKDSYIIYYSDIYDNGKSGMTIKIRGNTSAYSDKKPYKIKLEKKADLLNRNNDKKYEDKEWLLLKYNDLNTLVGFKVNELIKMQWTPAIQFVNVVINGDYRGLYMLTESVKRNPDCRLNVDKTGYIIEYDTYWWNEDVFFVSEYQYPMNYTFKYPGDDEITKEQIYYIKSYIDSLEVKIKKGEDYETYIDVNSWARWVLAHDILGTWDVGGSNVYITKFDKSSSSKLMMANLWDFDSNYHLTNTWSSQHNSVTLYYNELLYNRNTLFKDTYKSIWQEINPVLFNEMEEFLTAFEKSDLVYCIDRSIVLDNIRWNEKRPSVFDDISNSRSWFKSRQVFLNDNIPNL